MPFLRPFAAAALSAALALTAIPAQAETHARRIDPDIAAAALFGIATLAIIANSQNKNKNKNKNKKKKEKSHKSHAPRETGPIARHEHPRERFYDDPYKGHRGHGQKHHAARVSVPSDCARRIVVDGRAQTAFGAPCLRRSGVNLAHLPRRCARQVDVGRRAVTAWGAQCLHRTGVRIR